MTRFLEEKLTLKMILLMEELMATSNALVSYVTSVDITTKYGCRSLVPVH
jgi:hypothetical protein